jgi:hypothetical protein
MASNKSNGKGGKRRSQPGVWNRSLGRGPANPIRIRTKRLDEIDSDKIALAYWLLAKQIVEDQSDEWPLSEREVRRVAGEVEELSSTPPKRRRGSSDSDGRSRL